MGTLMGALVGAEPLERIDEHSTAERGRRERYPGEDD